MPDLEKILKDLNINYEIHEHPAVFTIEESDKIKLDIPGISNKNLFLRNKNADKFYLISLPGEKRLDIKTLQQTLNESKLSFASPEKLMHFLKLTPGSVTPFALIHQSAKPVTYLIDTELLNSTHLQFHPNHNTATLVLTREDFMKFLNWCGNEIRKVEL